MIINDKSIQGIFIYSDTSEYERGDFIVSGDSIYLCTPPKGSDTIVGKDPKIDVENYSLYLGGDKATWEDFEKQYTNQSDIVSDDKLITSSVLSQILRKLAFGIDSKGVISEHTMPISQNLNTLLSLSEYTDQETIIDHLLTTDNVPEYNNMTVRVSRNLFSGILPDIEKLEYDSIDTNSVILKQYTYYESASYTDINSDNKIRVQEVIDHINGVCLYRFARLGAEIAISNSSESKVGIPSSWKISCFNLQYLSKLNSLLKYVENTTSSNLNSFVFKDITSYLLNENINLDNYTTTYDLKSFTKDSELKSSTITISVVNFGNELVTYSYSITVDFSKKNITYAFPNNITVKKTTNNSLLLSWEQEKDKIKLATISNIYVKSYES